MRCAVHAEVAEVVDILETANNCLCTSTTSIRPQELVLSFVQRVFGETPRGGRKQEAVWQPQLGVRVLDTAALCAQLDAKAEFLEALLGYMEVRDRC